MNARAAGFLPHGAHRRASIMANAGDVLDLRPLGAIFRVTKDASQTGGASFDMEWELEPRSGGTPVHTHPQAAETYEVLEGALDLYVDGAWRTLQKGEWARVEKGVPHTFRNTDQVTRVRNTHEPAMRFDEYFAGLASLVERGVITSQRPSPRALLHLAALMAKYPDEIRSVKPPNAVVQAMARIARTLGYRI